MPNLRAIYERYLCVYVIEGIFFFFINLAAIIIIVSFEVVSFITFFPALYSNVYLFLS